MADAALRDDVLAASIARIIESHPTLSFLSNRIDSAPPAPVECPVAPGGPGVVKPVPAGAAGLYFCPVRVNKEGGLNRSTHRVAR